MKGPGARSDVVVDRDRPSTSLREPPPFSVDSPDFYRAVFYSPEEVRKVRRRRLGVAIGSTLLALIGLLIFSALADWHFDIVWRYESVGLLGAAVGTAELLSRYKDAPGYVLLSAPGIGYILINAIASVGALGLVRTFNWDFGATGDAAAATQVLLAGFGAMALFRSSLLTVKAGDNDVGIGPSSVLSVIMAASDRSADRLRAADRAGRVRDIMENVSFAKAHESLPEVAVALMQNLSPADVAALRVSVESLNSKTDLPDRTKSLLLGSKITDIVSTEVLEGAKASLGDVILFSEGPKSPARDGRRRDDVEAPATHVAAAEAIALNGPGTGGSTSSEPPTDPRSEEAAAESAAAGNGGSASEGLPQTPQTP